MQRSKSRNSVGDYALRPSGLSRFASQAKPAAAIASGTVIRPMFTSRVHKAPVPRGHRQWLEVRRG